jgi:two-component system CheB/CheR fusion protein
MLVLDDKLRIRTASRSFYLGFATSREDTEGQFVYDLGNSQWNIPALRTLLEQVMRDGKEFRNLRSYMISRSWAAV